MTTIAKGVSAKLFVAFVAAAMALALLAPAAQAQSEDDLQSQIDSLLATIAALQAQLGGSSSSMSCGFTFTDPMGQGATGAQALNLQKFLNSDPDTQVAASGVGSAGMESTYYGPLTAAAVSKFQVKYRAEILTPLGLANPTGYFGSSSITKANALCAGGQDGQDGQDGDDGDNGSSADLNGGEASLEDFDAQSGDEDEPAEGAEDEMVMDVEFDVEDGDVEVNRIDVAFDPGASNTEDDPWDVFENVAIYVDGDKIADVDTDDEDDWSDDDPATGDYKIRLSGLDWVVREGETAEFTVAVTIAGSVDGAGTAADWDIFIPTDGIRAVDGMGIQNYTGLITDTVNIDIVEEGGDDELKVSTSSDDPDATTLQLDSSEKSDWITVHAFDLDTDDSTNDITVDHIFVNIVLAGGATSTAVIDDLQLVVDGETYDDWSYATGTAASSTFDVDFDLDKDLVIDAGDEVTAELQVKFKALGAGYEGDTITASVNRADDIDAEGADDLAASQISGSSNGETHTLRSSGVDLDFVSATETFKENNDASTTDNQGEFTLKFDVTAFEDDIWVTKTAASGTTQTTSGVTFQIETGGGVWTTVDSSSAVLTSTADTDTAKFVVREGETETFTLKVTLDPTTAGYYQVQLYGINFSAGTAGAAATQQRALPESSFETDALNI
ncbi:MAG: hypothetical protein WDZ93_01950 [Candidatus Paceibacterota bacterium]